MCIWLTPLHVKVHHVGEGIAGTQAAIHITTRGREKQCTTILPACYLLAFLNNPGPGLGNGVTHRGLRQWTIRRALWTCPYICQIKIMPELELLLMILGYSKLTFKLLSTGFGFYSSLGPMQMPVPPQCTPNQDGLWISSHTGFLTTCITPNFSACSTVFLVLSLEERFSTS